MKEHLFKSSIDGNYVEVSVDGKLTYRWPSTGPERRFTAHLLTRLLSPKEQRSVMAFRLEVLAPVPEDALDFYLPPGYRSLSRGSLWNRFINLFKKEKQHARTQHDSRTQ